MRQITQLFGSLHARVGLGMAAALLSAGLSVATPASAQTLTLDTKKIPFYYLLVQENDNRITCVKYSSDCSYVRSPKLFEVSDGFFASSESKNIPVGW